MARAQLRDGAVTPARAAHDVVVALGRSGGIASASVPEFSFSGLKTAAAQYVKSRGGELPPDELRDFCASLQEAIARITSYNVCYTKLLR